MDGYHASQFADMTAGETGREEFIKELSDKDEEQSGGQGQRSAERKKECEMEADTDAHLDKEEKPKTWSDVCMPTAYSMVDDRRKRRNNVTEGEDKWVHIEEEVPEVP